MNVISDRADQENQQRHPEVKMTSSRRRRKRHFLSSLICLLQPYYNMKINISFTVSFFDSRDLNVMKLNVPFLCLQRVLAGRQLYGKP